MIWIKQKLIMKIDLVQLGFQEYGNIFLFGLENSQKTYVVNLSFKKTAPGGKSDFSSITCILSCEWFIC